MATRLGLLSTDCVGNRWLFSLACRSGLLRLFASNPSRFQHVAGGTHRSHLTTGSKFYFVRVPLTVCMVPLTRATFVSFLLDQRLFVALIQFPPP